MTAATPTAERDDAAYRALDFDFDPQISRQVLDETVTTLSRDNPAYRQVVEQELARRDVVAEYRETLGALGLRHDNLADTMAAYWVAMWTIIHDKPLANATAATAVRDQVLPRIQSNDLARSASKRQMMGEALIFEATIALSVYRDAKAGNQELQLRQMAQSAKKNTRKKGFDLARMKLTQHGMRRK